MSNRHRFKNSTDTIEEQTRKLRENLDTAIVYQEFIATFEEPTKVNKTWVKGGTVNPGSSTHCTEGAGRLYQPQLRTVDKNKKFKEKVQPEFNEKPPLPSKLKEQSKKKSILETFTEELKQIQQEREMRKSKNKQVFDRGEDTILVKEQDNKIVDEPRKSRFDLNLPPIVKPSLLLQSPSPFDVDFPYDSETDRTTTNLFLGNLNPELTEQQLCELFGRFGPLASVKIMWPRSEEEKARGRNCGFVAFMNRTDGERALEKLRGTEICGYEMKLGWGKTVLIPPHPIYVPPALLELNKPPPPSGLPFNAQPREWLQKNSNVDRKIFDMYSMSDEEIGMTLKTCVVKVTIPTDRPLLQLINRMVEFVVREGVEFEAFIMNKESRNPNFKFLFDFQCPEHVYYRWKLYSILHGENSKLWKTDEFMMYKDGPFWRPPPLNPYTSGLPEDLIEDIDFSKLTLENISQTLNNHESTKETTNQSNDVCMENPYSHNHVYKRQLTDSQRERLVQILVDLEPTKLSIGEAMVWCLEHADSAEDVLDVIVKQIEKTISYAIDKSVENSNTAGLNQIVALLFLISDILHNSCAKVRNASFYRKYIENCLPQIIISFNQFYLSLTSKIKSEQLKYKVLSCFRAWGDWYVYPFDFLQKMQNQFLGIIEPVQITTEEKSITLEENLLDGKPLVDYDGDPLDLDGIPLENNKKDSDEVDGIPLDSNKNVDIFDMFANPLSPLASHSNKPPLFVPSKWETVDPAEEENEIVQSRWQMMEAQAEDKKSSDNEDPDGYPLSDNDENFQLSNIKSSRNLSPNYKNLEEDDDSHVNRLVSYVAESSEDEQDRFTSNDYQLDKPYKSTKSKSVKRDSSPSRKSPKKSKSKKHESSNHPYKSSMSKSENSEMRSRVIKLDHKDESERRSRRSSRDSKRQYENDQSSSYSQSKRNRKSRSRSRSRSSRKSHKRKSNRH